MRKIRIVLSGLALVGLAGLVQPIAAQATAAPAASAALMADGFFYAAENPNGQGKYCRWLGNDGDWSNCSDPSGAVPGGMQNQASQMFNSGVPGGYDDVNVYYNKNYDGAYRCLAVGNHWDNLTLGWETFDHWGTNGQGYGKSINDDVASHKWVTSC
ncbi:peptidase inhibitor family I36 protein [Sphaerisporangium corydalis]|uniref:Peptidase inhibitor family I36 protein n=1 Tax=Sphaerisporangium corydalis TaxID=1441875 RepID=A0ABV9ER00_9ACTN|nr:peptidase inhibitor family I36 protein [Sphaerisporangium corydalis]